MKGRNFVVSSRSTVDRGVSLPKTVLGKKEGGVIREYYSIDSH